MRGPFGMTPACMGMFARMNADEVRDIVKLSMPRYRRIEGFDEKGFRQSLSDSMAAGYGIYGNIVLDRTTSGMGAAICDPSGYPVAGIGTTFITGWLDDAQLEQCAKALTTAATDIERRMLLPERPSPKR